MKAVIIGTAGRSHKELLTDKAWSNMVAKARELVPKGAMGISGGAAWADHIAVELYRLGHLSQLMLHLPAPIDNISCCFVGGYIGGPKSAASAANYYHGMFSQVLQRNTLQDIVEAIQTIGCGYTFQPPDMGLRAMFVRNALVAKEVSEGDMALAYTWDRGELSDSGTKNTWDQIKISNKQHVSMFDMVI